MAVELLEIDPTSEDAANSPLVIQSASSNYGVLEMSFPAPPLNVLYSSSVDTEGEAAVSRRYGNRVITITLDMVDVADTVTFMDALKAKVAKIAREGATLKYTRKDSSVRIADLVSAEEFNPILDDAYVLGHLTRVTLTLGAKPFLRGAEQDLGDNVETTLPVLVFTEASIPGDVPALGRLVIDNDATADQWWLTWGIQSKNYSSSANAALFYEAEGRTAMGGSAIAAGPSGASGAGSNVMRNTALSTSYLAVLSTQATGGGAHLSHIGTFRVFARVQVPTTNTGTVSVALEWGEGDFRRFTQNATTALDPTWEGSWRLVDLGLVALTKVSAGTQRWEGRILAKSTSAGDDLDVDWLMLVPVDEGSGEATAVLRVTTPTAFSARDEFDQSAGSLTGKTLPVGGTWAAAGGSAVDFTVETTGHTVQRTATSEGSDDWHRLAIAGTGTMTDCVVRVDFKTSLVGGVSYPVMGLIARETDANNLLEFVTYPTTTSWEVRVNKRVVGVVTTLSSDNIYGLVAANTWYTMTLLVNANGSYWAWLNRSDLALGSPLLHGADTALATAGALASGKSGFADGNSAATAATRSFDNFAAWVPVADAAVFASQSLEVRHDRVVREDSGGTRWETPSPYVGDYLRVPPSGAEARTARVIVKTSRNVPGQGPDSATDDVSARLFVTPRYL